MTSIANLDVSINTSGVAKGVSDLDKLTAAGSRAESAVEALAGATDSLGKATPAANAAAKALADLGKSAAGAGTAAGALNSALSNTGSAANKAAGQLGTFAAGQKLTAYQSQQLSFQLNDLFVQIASGQSPLTALIQQGSQLNGTFGGITGTLRALGSVFTVTNVAIAAAVVAVGGLGYAYYVGTKQSEDFRKSILLTGNAAGVTQGQFDAMVTSISEGTLTSALSVRGTLQTLVESSQFSGTALTSAAAAVQGLSRITGESTDKVAASFVKGAQNVTAFATTLNQSYNFLSAAQLQAIKDAEDQADKQGALAIVFEALNVRIGIVGQSTSKLGEIFTNVKRPLLELADAIAGLFRDATPEQQIAKIQARLAYLQKPSTYAPALAAAREQKTALEGQLAVLQQTVRENQRNAAVAADNAEKNRGRIALDQVLEKTLGNQAKKAKELADALAIARKNGATPEQIKQIEDFYAEKTPKIKKAPSTRADDNAEARAELEDIKSAGQAQLDEYQSQDRVLEARRAALLIRDKAYFDEKLRIARDSTTAQIETLKQENEFLAGRTLTGADASNRDRQIIANKTKIAQLNKQLATTETISGIQSEDAQRKVTVALDEARKSAESLLDVQQRAYDLGILSLSLSDRQAQGLAAIAAIQEKYEAQRQSIAADARRGQITQERADAELKIINEFEAKAIASYGRYYDAQVKGAEDAGVGMQKAIANYLDDANNAAKQSQEFFTSSFKGIEDALVTFATTGKLSFKSLANSIIADLARIAIKTAATKLFGESSGGFGGLLSLAGTLFGGSGGLTAAGATSNYNLLGLLDGARANGGPVGAGGLYQVNERGPELLNVAGKQYLMMGGQSGSVTPNGGGRGAGGVQIVNQTQGRIDRADAQTMDDGTMAIVISQVEDRIINGTRDPNGRMNGAISSSFKVQAQR